MKTFYDIDTPITIAKLREEGRYRISARSAASGFDVYFSFTGGPMLREIESGFGRHAPFLSIAPSIPKNTTRSGSKALCLRPQLHGNLRARPPAEDRRTALAIQHVGCRIRNSSLPARNIRSRAMAANVRRIKHLNPRWHPHFYSSSRFTLNVTRRDMVMAGYSPSVRLFEAAACGTAIISDNWPGLDTFFETREEILCRPRGDDVKNYLQQLAEKEPQRDRRGSPGPCSGRTHQRHSRP